MRNSIVALSAMTSVALSTPLLASCDLNDVNAALHQWAQRAPEHYTYSFFEFEGESPANDVNAQIPQRARVEVDKGRVMGIWYEAENSHPNRAGQPVPRAVWTFLWSIPPTLQNKVRSKVKVASQNSDETVDCEFDPATGFLIKLHVAYKSAPESSHTIEIKNFKAVP